MGELYDIAILDHCILTAHFFIHGNQQISIQQEFQQWTHAILVRYNELPDRGRLRDHAFDFCFPDRIAKRQSKDQYCHHKSLVIWFVLFVWLNETNQINQINQINQVNQPYALSAAS